MGAIDVKHTAEHELTLEWDSSSNNDMIADSTLALITGIDKSPASVKCKAQNIPAVLTSLIQIEHSDDTACAFALTCPSTCRCGV